MIINIREFIVGKKKERLDNRMRNMLQSDRAGVQAREEIAASKSISDEAKEILTVEELNAMLQDMSSSGFVYRVQFEGAVSAYRDITLSNYREFVDKLSHMDRDSQFIKAICLIDKCEEYMDYESMVRAFNITEYVIRLNKTNTPAVLYTRIWMTEMRRYMEELNLL